MDVKKYIRMALASKDMSESDLAREMGQSPQNLHNKYSRNTFKVSELEKMAEALGCELDIRFISKETGKPLI